CAPAAPLRPLTHEGWGALWHRSLAAVSGIWMALRVRVKDLPKSWRRPSCLSVLVVLGHLRLWVEPCGGSWPPARMSRPPSNCHLPGSPPVIVCHHHLYPEGAQCLACGWEPQE
uniref:Uncharacterized protein n=1 Tax=Sus scrofa TaxID=9823 RepID=A0A8D0TAR2_PIG